MPGQINDNITGVMYLSPTGDTVSVSLEQATGPQTPVTSGSVNDLLQQAFVDGKLRILIT